MPSSLPIVISVSAATATYAGGLLALRLQNRLTGLIGFSAGAVLGVAAFDLLPEAFDLRPDRSGKLQVILLVMAGFALYYLLSRLFAHSRSHESIDLKSSEVPGEVKAPVQLPVGSLIGVGSLATHSLLDGIGIGLAFKVSPAMGVLTGLGVLAHDFSDGINTVSLLVHNRGEERQILHWLAIDSLAPIVGVLIATYWLTISRLNLANCLAVFCGFFVYIGSCDLLPEVWRRASPRATLLFASLGAFTIYVAVRLAAGI